MAKLTILTMESLEETETEAGWVCEGYACDSVDPEPKVVLKIKIYPRKKRITVLRELVEDIPAGEWYCYEVTDVTLIERNA
jgi:hypothetical protein